MDWQLVDSYFTVKSTDIFLTVYDFVVLTYDSIVLAKDTGAIRGLPIDCDQ